MDSTYCCLDTTEGKISRAASVELFCTLGTSTATPRSRGGIIVAISALSFSAGCGIMLKPPRAEAATSSQGVLGATPRGASERPGATGEDLSSLLAHNTAP